jgi:hypothetical protein
MKNRKLTKEQQIAKIKKSKAKFGDSNGDKMKKLETLQKRS